MCVMLAKQKVTLAITVQSCEVRKHHLMVKVSFIWIAQTSSNDEYELDDF